MTPGSKKVFFTKFMKHGFLPIFYALQHRNTNFKKWNMRGRFALLAPYLSSYHAKKVRGEKMTSV
jgi:hypothetical protein